MHILVLGAGVVGLTTAYYLRRDGYQVTVVDANEGVGLATSYANGGQLSYSYVAPLAGPGVISKLPPWLLRDDSPLRFRPTLDPDQWRWCIRFLSACTRQQSDLTTLRLLRLSFLSRALMHLFLEHEPQIDFDYARSGKLVLHRDAKSLDSARDLLEYQRSLGCEQAVLTVEECVRLEPALSELAKVLKGGIYTESEESADCYRFCLGLECRLREDGVKFQLGTRVTHLKRSGDACVRVFAEKDELQADQIVLALGAESASLLKSLNIRLPLYPLKGYSLTLPVAENAAAPRVSVTDFQRKVVYARMGGRLRVAGMADLTGRQPKVDPARVATLRSEAEEAFPDAGDYQAAEVWAGLRPATPKGTPILGPTPYRNLWLNMGQGALGFTLALGSAKVVSDLIAGRKPGVALDGFQLAG
jgi:D-amino-acid dehydrogenase